MNRRQFIGGTAAISLAAATTLANAHGNHDHGSHSHAANSTDNAYEAARKAAGHCVSAGQVCLTHCITLLSKGDTSMQQCAAACQKHAAHHAECKACYESCTDCIKECEKIAA